MAQIFETLMLICFGLSWPFNIAKSLRSKTAKGKSMGFQLVVILGYLMGLTGKFISGNVTYVAVVYVLDILMVSCDFIITLRNHRLDKIRDQEEARA